MKTLLRWILGLVATVLALSIALSLAVMFLFDPNDYKDDIAALVSEQTGRSFSIDGDLSLQAFPCCGVALGPLTLGNPEGFPATPFARVERAVVDLQLWPLLLRREIRIGTVELEGFDAQLISRKDGSVNWEFAAADEGAAGEQAPQPADAALADLAIVGISIRNGSIGYTDEATGDALTFSDINLTTGKIVGGEPFELDASLLAFGLVPDARTELQLNAQLLLDADAQRIDATQLNSDIRITGDALPGGRAELAIELGAARGLGGERVTLDELVARVTVADLRATLQGAGALVNNAPELQGTLTVDSFSPQQLLQTLGRPAVTTRDNGVLQRAQLQGDWRYAGDTAGLENIVGGLDDTGITGWIRADSLEQEQLAFDLQVDGIDLDRYAQPEVTADGKAADAAAADSGPAFGLPVDTLRTLNLNGRLAVGKLRMAEAELSNVLVGVAARQGQIRLQPLSALFDGSNFAGDVRLDVTGKQPKLAFEMQVDVLDLDRYMPPEAEAEGAPAEGAGDAATGDEALDLPVAELRQLYLDGRVTAGKLKFRNAQLSDVDINISARDGIVRLSPLKANLYGGSYAGDMRLDVTGARPQLSVNEKLAGVQLGALLADASKVRNLEGLSDARVTATATGNTVNELLGNLAGDAALEMQSGLLRGVDLWYEIRKARAALKREAPPPRPAELVTDIRKLSATARFAEGTIANNDFNAEVSYLGITGKGTVDLLPSILDYRLEARVIGTPTFDDGKKLSDLSGLVLPITLKGNLASPAVKVDLGALAVSAGKRKLIERLEKKLGVAEPPADTGAAEQESADPATATQAPDEPKEEPSSEDPKDQLKKSLLKMLGE